MEFVPASFPSRSIAGVCAIHELRASQGGGTGTTATGKEANRRSERAGHAGLASCSMTCRSSAAWRNTRRHWRLRSKEQGHTVSALSAAWIPEDNQYLARLRQHGVPVAQPPKWSRFSPRTGQSKEKIVAAICGRLRRRLAYWAWGVSVARTRRSWRDSWTSARNWLQGQLMQRVIGPDRRRTLDGCCWTGGGCAGDRTCFHIQGYTSICSLPLTGAAAHGIAVVYEEHQTPDARFDWWQGFGASNQQGGVVVAVSEASAEALRDVCGVTQPAGGARTLFWPTRRCAGETTGQTGSRRWTLSVTTVARLGVTKGLTYVGGHCGGASSAPGHSL